MKKQLDTKDKIFSALADPTRRKIIELLHRKDSTLLELSSDFSISFQALSKHIKILESAELLIKEKRGKYRILKLNGNSLRQALEWISFYSNFWNESFENLTEIINEKDRHADRE